MADNKLEIILEAIDNATAEINKVKESLKGVETSTKEVTKKTEEAGKSIKQQFKEAGSELKDFRRSMLLVTAAIAIIISTTKEAAKYSKEAKNSYEGFDIALKTLSVTLGQLFAPALEGVSFIVRTLTTSVEAVVAGFIKLSNFVAEFFANLSSGPVVAYQQAMLTANIATDEFLNKMEETKNRVSAGLTFEQETKNVMNLGKITVANAKMQAKAWDGVVSALDQLQSALAGAEEMGRGFAVAAQIVAIGLAIINTARGVTLAFATYPWPYSMVVAGIVGVAGALQIATIAATKFHEGGLIKAHSGLAVDEVPIIAQTGEGVLSRRGMGALGGVGALNRLNGGFGGGGSYTHIEINYPTIRSDADIDRLTEEISIRLAREAERL